MAFSCKDEEQEAAAEAEVEAETAEDDEEAEEGGAVESSPEERCNAEEGQGEVESLPDERCNTEEAEDEEMQEEEENKFDPFDDPNDPNYEEGMETEDAEEDSTEASQEENLEKEDALFNILPSHFAFSDFVANPHNKPALCEAVDYAISADLQAQYSKKRPRFSNKYCPNNSKKPKVFTTEEAKPCTDKRLWLSRTLSSIEASLHMLSPAVLHTQNLTYPELRKLRTATMVLLQYTEAAIHNARERETNFHRQEIEGMQIEMEKKRKEIESELAAKHAKYRKLKRKLRKHVGAEPNKVLKQATEKSTRQTTLMFEREKEALKVVHRLEREAWMALHELQVKDLKKQLEEKQNTFCLACQEKPRDVVVVPCFHLEYCFACLLQHRDKNGNTCPQCEGPIQGFCMSTYQKQNNEQV